MVQNNWAIFHDPQSFDDPEVFKPERFLSNEFGLKAGVDNESAWRNTFSFGAGRRICQGVGHTVLGLASVLTAILYALL